MNTEKYIVRLSDKERQKLESIVKKLRGTLQKTKRAIVLLKADTLGRIGPTNKSTNKPG